MSNRPRANWRAYLNAALAIAAASLIGAVLAPWLTPNVLYFTYFAAVAFAGWYGGFGPALFATLLSYLTANLLFIPPDRAFSFNIVSFTYLFVCVALAAFSEAMRRALRRAEASAEQVISLVQSISDGFVALDERGHCTYMNRAAEALHDLHHPHGESAATDGFPLPLAGADSQRLRHAAAAGASIEFEAYCEPWRRWFEIKGSPADNGGLAVHFRDVTERKKAEDGLRYFSEIGTVLAGVSDLDSMLRQATRFFVPALADWCVIDIIGPHGDIERIAHAHRDETQEAILRQMIERTPLDWNSTVPIARVMRTGQAELYTQLPADFAGSIAADAEHARLIRLLAPRSMAIVPLRVRDQTIGTLSLMTSASGRQFSQDDLNLMTELARRTATAVDSARLYRDLKTAERQKDDFLAMLAHELRNPLAAIQYANELLKISSVNPDPAVEVIDRQLGNLTHLIGDLLDVSRITQDKIQLKPELFDAAELLERAIATARPAIDGRGHELVLEVAGEPLPILVDPVRGEQILVNLLTNAAKYTAEGGRIVAGCLRRQQQVIFTVRDTGVGIAPEMLPRVFELFTQADQSLDRSQGGLGIGLTVVRKLAEMHGGRVWARSEGPGRGCEFIVALPLSNVAAPRPTEHAPIEPISSARKVLVVDDNVDTAKSISQLLTTKGFTSAMAHDGHAALALAHDFGPDVVLLDLGLPGIDGYRVAEILRGEQQFANVRFIALSGYGQPADRTRSREAGFNEHLVKPVAFQTLLSALLASSTPAN